MQFLSEDEQLVFDFKTHFDKCKKNSIVLYGSAHKVGVLIHALTDYHIVGILCDDYDAKWAEERMEYGSMPIWSYEDAVANQADIIIAAVSPNRFADIYNKVYNLCSKNAMSLFGANGEDLFEKFGTVKTEIIADSYFDFGEEDMLKAINKNEVICFSIFDVLLMKKSLLDADNKKIIEKWKNKGMTYFDAEEALTVPRKKMVEIFGYAVEQKKIIYLILEKKMPLEIIEKLFFKYNIIGYKKICICAGANKEEIIELLCNIKNIEGKEACLYIGSNYIADSNFTSTTGFDYIKIKSARDMLAISSYASIRTMLKTVNERSMVGIMAADMFNNPFSLHKRYNGRIEVADIKKFTKFFIAPLITAMVLWIAEISKKKGFDEILFASRDGFLIEKLYNKLRLKKEFEGIPAGRYFLISRRAASNAAIMTENDLERLFSLPYKDTPKKVLIDKFGFDDRELLSEEEDYQNMLQYALQHKRLIMDKSEKLRNNFIKYIYNQELDVNRKYGFYDMVSSGTSQYFLQKIFPADIEGVYLCWYDRGDMAMRHMPITAMYVNNRVAPDNSFSEYIEGGYVYQNYAFLELLLSSPDSSLREFGEEGNPIYLDEVRETKYIDMLQSSQGAIEDFFDEYINNMYVKKQRINADVVDELFRYSSAVYTNVNILEFEDLVNHDDFGLQDVKIDRVNNNE